jgi:hypothetical protein
MPLRKSTLPILVQQGHVDSRGQLVFSDVASKRSGPSSLDRHVKRLRIFSPPQKRRSETSTKSVDISHSAPLQDHDEWEDDISEPEIWDSQPNPVPTPKVPLKTKVCTFGFVIIGLLIPPCAQGNNQYMKDWMKNHSAAYLQALYAQECAPNDQQCTQCQTAEGRFLCSDCTQAGLLCKECLLDNHQQFPFHKIKAWNNDQFNSTNLNMIGYVLQLGHHGHACEAGVSMTCELPYTWKPEAMAKHSK